MRLATLYVDHKCVKYYVDFFLKTAARYGYLPLREQLTKQKTFPVCG